MVKVVSEVAFLVYLKKASEGESHFLTQNSGRKFSQESSYD